MNVKCVFPEAGIVLVPSWASLVCLTHDFKLHVWAMMLEGRTFKRTWICEIMGWVCARAGTRESQVTRWLTWLCAITFHNWILLTLSRYLFGLIYYVILWNDYHLRLLFCLSGLCIDVYIILCYGFWWYAEIISFIIIFIFCFFLSMYRVRITMALLRDLNRNKIWKKTFICIFSLVGGFRYKVLFFTECNIFTH